MTNWISRELRYKAVIHYKHFLHSLRKVSRLYGVSKSSLQHWLRDDPACPKRRKKQEIKACVVDAIKQCIALNPFVTALDVSRFVAASCNVHMSRSTGKASLYPTVLP